MGLVSLGFIGGSVFLGVVMLLMIPLVLLLRRYLQLKKQHLLNIQDVEAGFYVRRFSWSEIQEATKDFHEDEVIGYGGFGTVYRGKLRDGTKVAVKRKDPNARQGYNEFYTEVKFLSQLRHKNIVPLLGFYHKENEMILIYEFLENGTLHSHLYDPNKKVLTWKQRLEICIGAARGIDFLHNSSEKGVIHRDVKPTNVLLDGKLHAKVADFGLSRNGHGSELSHVITGVKGTFGYLDVQYFQKHQLTEKSDVYSFGVLMLEVLCAKPTHDNEFPWENVKRRQPQNIIDPRISGTIKASSLNIFVKLINRCLADDGAVRPSMEQVVMELKHVLMDQYNFDLNEAPHNLVGAVDLNQPAPNFDLDPVIINPIQPVIEGDFMEPDSVQNNEQIIHLLQEENEVLQEPMEVDDDMQIELDLDVQRAELAFHGSPINWLVEEVPLDQLISSDEEGPTHQDLPTQDLPTQQVQSGLNEHQEMDSQQDLSELQKVDGQHDLNEHHGMAEETGENQMSLNTLPQLDISLSKQIAHRLWATFFSSDKQQNDGEGCSKVAPPSGQKRKNSKRQSAIVESEAKRKKPYPVARARITITEEQEQSSIGENKVEGQIDVEA